jgi:hypothetical protein
MGLDVSSGELAVAIERQHGGVAVFAQSVPARESFDGVAVLEDVIHVFDLVGNPNATAPIPGPRPPK